ncbi:MAG: type II CAAX endopeptidase family protein [Candidatus Obscuribacterales bacterium]|nr:type II CAAX endopeptidase family protein [Candidatus Obscuribacterales bacterium]
MPANQLSQLIPLLIWLLALFLVGSAALVSGFVSLVLSGQARTKAIDVFFVLSTLAVVLGLAGNVLPHDALDGGNKKSLTQKSVHDADHFGNRLTEYTYIAQVPQPFDFLIAIDGSPRLDEALKSAETYVKKQLEKYPNNVDLIVRLAILEHENKKDVSKVLGDDGDEGKIANELLDSLRILYTLDKEKITPDVGRVLENKLPKGWYRDAALQYFYKATKSTALGPFLRDKEKLGNEWRQKLEIAYVLRSIFCCIGFITIFRFIFLARKEQAEATVLPPEPRYFPFRNWYGCALALFYTYLVTGVAMAFCFGLWNALTHSNWQLSSMVMIVNSITVFISAAVFLLCVDVFIRRPAGIGSWLTFLAERSIRFREFIFTVLGGFCSMVAVLTLLRIILVAVPGIPVTPSNATQSQMIDALSAANSPMICFLIILICILGPFLEEILFRGLMYPWIRHRVGILWAIVATSLAFGLWHFDLAGLGYYFAMGVILNLLFQRKRNLLVNFATHAVWNIWAVLWMVAIVVR